jgi:uncharacterized protein YacL
MSGELISRIIGLIILAIGGIIEGFALPDQLQASGLSELFSLHFTESTHYILAAVLGVLSGALGFWLTPHLVLNPLKLLINRLIQIPTQKLVAGLLGLLSGLILASLLTFPFSRLPVPLSQILPTVFAILFSYLGALVFMTRSQDILAFLRNPFSSRSSNVLSEDNARVQAEGRPILMDTSVIIDGRIADVAQTGFITGTLVIPRFVLNELQYIADSADSMRRQRGRRGMEIISLLQKNTKVPVRISDIDVEGIRDVDEKLVVLARQLQCPILTNDYNLNRIAELQGVPILNINELANAVKAILLPGELLSIKVIQEGKEANQGVGYLEDGTMVVVEEGKHLIARKQETTVVVTKVLQTAAGRMIFARQQD